MHLLLHKSLKNTITATVTIVINEGHIWEPACKAREPKSLFSCHSHAVRTAFIGLAAAVYRQVDRFLSGGGPSSARLCGTSPCCLLLRYHLHDCSTGRLFCGLCSTHSTCGPCSRIRAGRRPAWAAAARAARGSSGTRAGTSCQNTRRRFLHSNPAGERLVTTRQSTSQSKGSTKQSSETYGQRAGTLGRKCRGTWGKTR